MIKKKFIIFIFLFLLNNCDYKPIYSNNNNVDFYIESIEFNDGDVDIINNLKRNLNKLQEKKEGKKLSIKSTIQYDKKVIGRDSSSSISEYNLVATGIFIIQHKDEIITVKIQESLNMNNFEDEFEENKYEKNVKKNIAKSMSTKLVMQLLKINDN